MATTRDRWNLLLAGLLMLNLLRWGVPWATPASAHPAGEEAPPPLPDSVITLTDEEWEAEEMTGTTPEGPGFMVVPYKKLGGTPFQVLDRVGVSGIKWGMGGKAATELKEVSKAESNGGDKGSDKGGDKGDGKGDGKAEEEGKDGGGPGPKGAAAAATLVVTKWRVRGHMHRTRTHP